MSSDGMNDDGYSSDSFARSKIRELEIKTVNNERAFQEVKSAVKKLESKEMKTMNRAEYRKESRTQRVELFSGQIKVMETQIIAFKQLLENQKDKIAHLTFSLYRTQGFVDFILQQNNLTISKEALKEIEVYAIQRTNEDFPGMNLSLPAEEIKDTDAHKASQDIYDSYYKQHKLCPNCKSKNHKQTLLGYHFQSLETAKDENKSTCLDCGWIGIVHDLLPPE